MLAIGNGEKCPGCDLIMKDFKIGDLDSMDHMVRYHAELLMEGTKNDVVYDGKAVVKTDLPRDPMEVKYVPNTRVNCIDQALRLLHPECKKGPLEWYNTFTGMTDDMLNGVAQMAESIYANAKKSGV